MKKYLLLFPFTLLLTITNGFSQEYIPYYASVVEQCSQTNITNNLTSYESLGLKKRGTTALQNTLDWLKVQYLGFGYTPAQIAEDSYTYSGSTSVCKNLIVTKIGTIYPNTYVIVCGHYDSIGGTGTNDNGSGLVSILETARLLHNIPTEYSIKFINFSGEEDGLKGSQHFVSAVVNGTTPKMDIRLVINIDEVGGVAGLINDTITCERDQSNNPSSNNALSATMTDELINCVGLYSPLNANLSYAYASDYMSFQSNNEIITGLFETNETTHKHTNSDLLIYMDPVYNYKVAKALIGATMHFAVATTSTLGNDSFQNDNQVSFFPSPAKNILNINLGDITDTDYSFSLIDLQGKVVINKQIENAHLIESVSLDGLSKGMYLAVLQTASKRITKKIIVE
ncbi:M28 family peptidase [Flavobacterium paronense]|uniref:M28 family peptidase n=1 Tax=Flavobacterium paronense TaxID=1392775 RepID=A0ABV5GH76_9FLAO|nr:M28 family peptidase [Flavobacterium paronense]MDN3677288.1 M28 family peptidase [Flavobacterium paronense]